MRSPLLYVLFAFLIAGNATTAICGKVSVKRDPDAIAYMETAIAALGGDAGWQGVKDSVVEATLTPTKDSWVKPASLVWKTYQAEFRYEANRDSVAHIFVSGFGKPAVSDAQKISPLFYHVAQCAPPFHFPAPILSKQLADQTYSIVNAGEGIVSGQPAHKVQTSSTASDVENSMTLQTWYFDESTGLPLRVEYRVPEATDMNSWTEAATEFSDFRKVSELLLPFSMTIYEEDVALELISVDTAQFNVGLDPSEFDLLGGKK